MKKVEIKTKNQLFLHRSLVAVLLLMLLVLHVHAQNITLNKKEAKITDVLKEIRKQTGYNFVLNDQLINKAKPVTLNVNNVSLKHLLDEIFQDQPFTYSLHNRIITIIPKSTGTITLKTQQQEPILKGLVMDKSGRPVSGASVRLIKEGTSTRTQKDGSFQIIQQITHDSITVSYLGYKKQTIALQPNSSPIKIILTESTEQVQDVVVTGIYSRNKDSFTGSASRYSGKELKQVGNSNIIQSLKTLDPTFNMVENNLFGSDPNRLPNLEIRGKSSIVGLKEQFGTDPNQPLFILDGFEVPLRTIMDLNMNRVESINILKDAASTAIYGSRAANGVVVIETKAPLPGELRLTYSSDINFAASDFSSYNLMNATEKLEFERLAGRYNYIAAEVNPQGQRYLDSLYNERNKEVARGVNTYWLNEPVRNAFTHGHNLYAEGGSDIFRFGLGLSHKDLNGVMKGSGRNTTEGNIDLTYRKGRLNFSNKTAIEYYKSTESPYGSFSSFSRANPYYRKSNEDGSIDRYLEVSRDHQGWDYTVTNPMWNALLGNLDNQNFTGFRNNLKAEWQYDESLQLRARVGLNKGTLENEILISPQDSRFDLTPNNLKGRYENGRTDTWSYEGELVATYGKLFNNRHLLNVVAGWNFREAHKTNKSFAAVGFPEGVPGSPAFANTYPQNSRPAYIAGLSRATSFFSNMGYAYRNRYLMDFSYRADGSSIFGSNHLFTQTWSLGLAWNLHHEKWLADTKIFDILKLRGSIGNPGNQNFNSYQSFTTYTYNTNVINNFGVGAMMEALGNPDLKWQKTLDKNIGLDAVTLNNKLRVNLDVYNKKTDPLLAIINTPASMGFPILTTNFGAQINQGINGMVSYSPIYRPDERINWTVSLNGRSEKAKFSNLEQALKSMNDENKGINLTRYYDGGSPTSIWAVPSLGIDPSSGRELFVKKNGEQTFTHNYEDEIIVGNTMPKWEGVLGNTFYYKDFNIAVYIRYRVGGQQFNQAIYDKVENISIEGLKSNQDKRAFYDRWKQPGDIASFRGITLTENTPMSSRFVQDDNSIMGESFSLGYTVHQGWIQKVNIDNLNMRLYFNDFFRQSNIKTERGIDYPFARSVSFSLNLTF
ncbi:SusC/RagA family TonB-linked outer membrane protein [Sphingobacterium faecale]|uniref:SusC/RagA family TonB-linked outer membrane protein n=1 Tax=Sphingobacterium faecale TaxID=2803775 RepID=A0ABS1R7T6_9SPHI|nr:SusC/RagA family TonB-linked outer membrane protein [Sphingobacterium faecale]MBL1410733.1 SusC/RagA family TonB-linked outer membrane protein [Sphingobacterium faecale]